MNSNILIVDDEAAVLQLLKDILTSENYTVRLFNNGELALRSIELEAPELIVLDIRMPDMDGFEVCRRIKKNTRLKEVPVMFISAAADLEDKIKAFQVGGVDYITKPFQKEEVLARVRTHVALSHSMRELKQVETALRKSEERLKIAQAIAHVGHWEWDAEAGQFICSEEMGHILGLAPQERQLAYDRFLQMVHPDDRERVASQMIQAFSGKNFDIDYRILLPGGRRRVVHGIGSFTRLNAAEPSALIGVVHEYHESEQAKMLGVVQDITERKELEQKLEQLANTDALTGCVSRRYFLEQAEREIVRSRRYSGELSVLMLDMDHFKAVNDKHGHQVGDMVLKKLVQVCQGVLREMDLIGRLGGEEFAILLPETGSDHALEAAERLRQAVSAADVPVENAELLRFTISIGVASLQGGDTGIDQLLGRADEALYEAKNAGRNKVCVS